MLTPEQIHEVRRISRLEALRAAVFSVAAESLEEQTPRLFIEVCFENGELEASFEFGDRNGNVMMGGVL